MKNKIYLITIGAVLGVLLGLLQADAKTKTQSTSYITFELEDSWDCKQIKEIFACAPRQGAALVAIAAKIPGKDDNMAAYQKFLKEKLKRVDVNGKAFESEPKLVKVKDINGVKWVDGIHLASEVPGHLTRYLATVHNGVAILVTYTVEKDSQLKFAPVLLNMAKTLKVIAQPPRDKVKALKPEAEARDKSNIPDPGAPKGEKVRSTASSGKTGKAGH